MAIVLRNQLLDHLKDVCMLQAGICIELQLPGMRIQVVNVHIPHPKTADAGEVALEMAREIGEFSSRLRYFDKLIVLEDFNLDLQMPCEGGQRPAAIRSLVGLHGTGLRCMDQDTWFARGPSSRIDFIPDSFEDGSVLELETLQQWRHTLGCDHDTLLASIKMPNGALRNQKRKRKQPPGTNCGRWNVNLMQAPEEVHNLQVKLVVREQRDMLVEGLESLARASCHRPRTYRYQDCQEIKELIQLRKTLQRDDSRKLANRIVALRKSAKQEWLESVLRKAAQGDFAAVRQGIQGMRATYMHNAGGPQRAVMELKPFMHPSTLFWRRIPLN